MQNIILFVLTYFFAISLDFIWLRFIASTVYIESLGSLMRMQGSELAYNIPSALAVYALISFGILYFALPKSGDSYTGAMLAGACFGLVTYGIYEFTNYAILANWPLKIILIDCIWGIISCMLTTCFALFVSKIIK